jgi:energy-coupling factor transport system substrate-specific component
MNKRIALVFVPVGIGINIVGGLLASSLKLPVFLDTIGTILAAAILGPWWGALTGGLTNVIMSLQNPMDMWFAIVNIAVGLIVGFVSIKFGFQKWLVVLVTGLIISVVAPLIGTVIATYVYGGLTGGGLDIFVAGLMKSGTSVFTAAFLPRVGSNLIDKLLSVFLVMFIILALPRNLRGYAAGPDAAPAAPVEPALETS